jgi:ABC-type polysaccharide/polyol phosphate export permease
VLTQLVDAGIGTLALVLALPFFSVHLSTAFVWVIPLVCMLIMITTGPCCSEAVPTCSFATRSIWYSWSCPSGFSLRRCSSISTPSGRGCRIAMLNPLSPVLEGLRLAVVHGHNCSSPPSAHGDYLVWAPWYLGYAAIWAVVLLGASAVIFHRSEFVFAEYV